MSVTSFSNLSSNSIEFIGNDIFDRRGISLSESDLTGSLYSLRLVLRLNTLFGLSVFGGFALCLRFREDDYGMFGEMERFRADDYGMFGEMERFRADDYGMFGEMERFRADD